MPYIAKPVSPEHHKEHHVHHPAHNMYLITIIIIALVVIMGFITVFIPWAMKDIGVGQRAWAFPFKTCIENTFSTVNEETCIDNDFIEPQGVPLTGKNEECKAYILGTIAMVFISVLVGVVLLLILGYILEHLWWLNIWVAVVAQVLIIIVCIASYLAWGLFIVYLNMVCAENSIFPVEGYSYGWIMYLFISAIATIAILTGFYGLKKLLMIKDMERAMSELRNEIPMYNVYANMPGSPYLAMTPSGEPYPQGPHYLLGDHPHHHIHLFGSHDHVHSNP